MTASGLMGRLPTFPTATVDEVIDIRTELAPSLAKFRSAMVSIAKSFSSSAWESDFEDEVHDAWVESVFPAVEDIEASVRDNNSLFSLATGITGATNRAYPGLSIVAAGLLGHVGAAALVGGAFAGAAPMLQAIRDRNRCATDIRMQPFYFLYAADRALG